MRVDPRLPFMSITTSSANRSSAVVGKKLLVRADEMEKVDWLA